MFVKVCWAELFKDVGRQAPLTLQRGQMFCLETLASADLLQNHTLLSILQDSMALYSSIIIHSGILENVVYFKYNDKMLHFEKDDQHQVGFVLTMLLRIVASLLMQVKKTKKQKNQSLQHLRLKFCTIAKHF